MKQFAVDDFFEVAATTLGSRPNLFPPPGKRMLVVTTATHKLLFTYVRPLRGTRSRGSCSEASISVTLGTGRRRNSGDLMVQDSVTCIAVTLRARNFFFSGDLPSVPRPLAKLSKHVPFGNQSELPQHDEVSRPSLLRNIIAAWIYFYSRIYRYFGTISTLSLIPLIRITFSLERDKSVYIFLATYAYQRIEIISIYE